MIDKIMLFMYNLDIELNHRVLNIIDLEVKYLERQSISVGFFDRRIRGFCY